MVRWGWMISSSERKGHRQLLMEGWGVRERCDWQVGRHPERRGSLFLTGRGH